MLILSLLKVYFWNSGKLPSPYSITKSQKIVAPFNLVWSLGSSFSKLSDIHFYSVNLLAPSLAFELLCVTFVNVYIYKCVDVSLISVWALLIVLYDRWRFVRIVIETKWCSGEVV